jgi:tRNA pseudouridine55 synthase
LSHSFSVRRAVDGVLLLDKPTGITSNTAIQRAKRLLAAAKAGHVGTLDPMASGLLPVCFGEATKFSTDTFSADKSYEAEILLGVTTTTGDCEGDVTSRCAVSVTREAVGSVLAKFTGELEQTPPMFSALKRDGKPLYEYARAGLTVERVPRRINIRAIGLLSFSADRLKVDVSCSKGTYIRVLAEDIGAALGCGATLSSLRRTRVGDFDLSKSVTLSAIEALPDMQRIDALLRVDSLVATLPAVSLDLASAKKILLGQAATPADADKLVGLVRLYGPDARFLGIGTVQEGGRLAPKRLIATAANGNARAYADVGQAPKIA